MRRTITVARLAFVLAVVLTVPVTALEWTLPDGVARGFPALRDRAGKAIADGDFVQWVEGDRLHVRITYVGPSRRIEENAVFRQRPELVQEQWSLREMRDGKLFRHFAVDFAAGTASAKKVEDGELKDWSDDVKVDAGQAFAGFGFTLAVRALRRRLRDGAHVELETVGFTPKPRVVTVEVSHGGLDRLRMASRTIRGERYIVHPKLPFIAELFVNVPDAQIWLTTPEPATFLRWEGPLAEPSDPITRVDLLPGGISGPAVPIPSSRRRD
jgi:hypothetical protein